MNPKDRAYAQRLATNPSETWMLENHVTGSLITEYQYFIFRYEEALQAAEKREQILREALQQIVYEYEQATHAPTFATLAYKAAQDTLNEMEVKR